MRERTSERSETEERGSGRTSVADIRDGFRGAKRDTPPPVKPIRLASLDTSLRGRSDLEKQSAICSNAFTLLWFRLSAGYEIPGFFAAFLNVFPAPVWCVLIPVGVEARMILIAKLEMPWKILASGFLMVLSGGFFTAHMLLDYSVAGASGNPSPIPTLEDITAHYHGKPNSNRLKTMSLGAMKKYFSDSGKSETLSKEEQANLDTVVKWSEAGGPEAEFWTLDPEKPGEYKPGPILTIFENNCTECHSPKGKKADAPLDTFKGATKFTKPDPGMDMGRLLTISHIHLLGMSLMFLGAGLFFAATRYPSNLRSVLIGLGFISIALDIGGWWLVKLYGALFAPVVMAGGILMGVAFALIVFLTLRDIWVAKDPA